MNDFSETKFPLVWPDRWQRTSAHERGHSRFAEHSVAHAFDFLCKQMWQLTDSWIMSSNVPRNKRDGNPESRGKLISDPGIAVYFKFKSKPHSLACDKWVRVEDNIWAIAKHVEALRGQDRWGVGTLEQAFTGYLALPGVGQSSGHSWWTVLGVPINATEDQVKEAYRVLAKKHHPDRNGNSELFVRINEAWRQFGQVVKKPT